MYVDVWCDVLCVLIDDGCRLWGIVGNVYDECLMTIGDYGRLLMVYEYVWWVIHDGGLRWVVGDDVWWAATMMGCDGCCVMVYDWWCRWCMVYVDDDYMLWVMMVYDDWWVSCDYDLWCFMCDNGLLWWTRGVGGCSMICYGWRWAMMVDGDVDDGGLRWWICDEMVDDES